LKIRWLGHASFLIESPALKIITDPFGKDVPYPEIRQTADVVTVSHEHHDHNAIHVLDGEFQVLRGLDPETKKARRIKEVIEGVEFRTVPSFHDGQEGKLRGENGIFVMDIDGITLAHLGDLGEALAPSQAKEIGQVHILFVPVGGYYTIDAVAAKETVGLIKPNIMVPMHYKTKYIDSWPVAIVDSFLEGEENVMRLDGSECSISKADIPESTQVWVFTI